jgi:hypothetical protein
VKTSGPRPRSAPYILTGILEKIRILTWYRIARESLVDVDEDARVGGLFMSVIKLLFKEVTTYLVGTRQAHCGWCFGTSSTSDINLCTFHLRNASVDMKFLVGRRELT